MKISNVCSEAGVVGVYCIRMSCFHVPLGQNTSNFNAKHVVLVSGLGVGGRLDLNI